MEPLVNKSCILCVLLLFLCHAVTAPGRVIYVDDDGPADFNNIQAAIDDANHGDTVVIADGRYTGDGNRDIDFKGRAIAVRSENSLGRKNEIGYTDKRFGRGRYERCG